MDTNNNFDPNQMQQRYQSGTRYDVKPVKKKTNAFVKIVLAIVIGLFFGIFAALGFQAVNAASNLIKSGVAHKSEIESGNFGNPLTEFFSQGERDENASTAQIDEETDDGTEDETDETDEEQASKAAELIKQNPEVERPGAYGVVDVTEVVKNTMPSIVAVNNKYTAKMSYFGQIYQQEAEASGSGIIVGKNDTELLVVTNFHVVEDADELIVTFMDDSQVTAQIKGTESDKDLAVIAIPLTEIDSKTMQIIQIASLGDSDALLVGEPVVAIGNSLGYGQSVTTGVVSALERMIGAYRTDDEDGKDMEEAPKFIQTDAAINPGNSGGALLNMKGEVIGINSNKIGGASVEGMGYAIPISHAKPIIQELMNKTTRSRVDEESRGFLGITGVDVEEEYSQIYGLPIGIYVSSVNPGSGADKAGLIKGDIIVAIDGETVESMEELKSELAFYEAGSTVELTIMQGSPTGYKDKKVKVTLGKASK